MNRVWLICLCAGLIFAMGNGGTQAVNDLFMNIGKDTFDFVVPLLCVTCFWNGILNVAKDSGLLRHAERLFHPLLSRLFPDVRNPEALGYIVTNVVVNMFGLGSAATRRAEGDAAAARGESEEGHGIPSDGHFSGAQHGRRDAALYLHHRHPGRLLRAGCHGLPPLCGVGHGLCVDRRPAGGSVVELPWISGYCPWSCSRCWLGRSRIASTRTRAS